MVTDFWKWLEATHGLDENGARTSLGIYPRAYGYAGTHPPLASTPVSAGAARAFSTTHKDWAKDTNPKPKSKKKKKG